MRMERTDVQVLVWPLHDPSHWLSFVPASTCGELLVRVHTDASLTGLGRLLRLRHLRPLPLPPPPLSLAQPPRRRRRRRHRLRRRRACRLASGFAPRSGHDTGWDGHAPPSR